MRADVWSLGVTLVQLARGFCPYAASNDSIELLLQIKTEEPPRLDPAQFSPDFCDFVAQCLLKSNEHRPKYKHLQVSAPPPAHLTPQKMPFYQRSKESEVDVGHWMANQDQYSPPFPPPGP